MGNKNACVKETGMRGLRGGAHQGGAKDRKSLDSQHEWVENNERTS
jgi:hypothetical protein